LVHRDTTLVVLPRIGLVAPSPHRDTHLWCLFPPPLPRVPRLWPSPVQTESVDTLNAKGMLTKGKSAAADDDQSSSTGAAGAVAAATGDGFTPMIKSSITKQLYWLTKRELLNIRRDVTAMVARFGITIFLSVLFGLIFLGAGGNDDSDPNNFQAHFGALTMVFISAMFGPAQSVMLAFPFERPMFMREYATGTYSAFSYFLTKSILEMPVTFAQTVVQFILCYYMINLQGSFIYIVLTAWGLGAASCSVAVLIGCLVSDVKDATELAPLLFVPQLLFSGFFINTSKIPVFLRWAQYLCALKYAINLVLLTEFSPGNPNCQVRWCFSPYCRLSLPLQMARPLFLTSLAPPRYDMHRRAWRRIRARP